MAYARRSIAALLLAGWMPMTGASARAGDDEALRTRVMKEYPAALARLEKDYSRVHGVLKRVKDAVSEKGIEPNSASQVAFYFDGDSRKTTAVRSLGKGSHTHVICQTPAGYFRVTRKKEGDPPALANFGTGKHPELEQALMSFEIDTFGAPFSIGQPVGTTIADILKQPNFAFDRVGEVERDGRKLLELAYTVHVRLQRAAVDVKYRLVVSPDEGWALREFEAKDPKFTHSMVVDYGPMKGGIPIVKRVVRTSRSIRETIDIEDLEFGPSPPEEFRLKSTGLPEVDATSAPRSPDRTPQWLIGGGLLAAALAVVVRVATRGVSG